jgi:uncharacterized protein YukE
MTSSVPGQFTATTEYVDQCGRRLEDLQGQVQTCNTQMFAEAVPLVSGRWTGQAASTAARIVTALEADAKALSDLLARYAPAVRQTASSVGAQEEAAVASLNQASGNTLNLDINKGPVNIGG